MIVYILIAAVFLFNVFTTIYILDKLDKR